MAIATPNQALRERAAALRGRLEALADALAARDVTAVLACEAELGAILAPMTSLVAPSERTAVTAEIEAARAALARCRALGAANQLLADVSLEALGRTGAYGRDGASHARSPRGYDVVTRA